MKLLFAFLISGIRFLVCSDALLFQPKPHRGANFKVSSSSEGINYDVLLVEEFSTLRRGMLGGVVLAATAIVFPSSSFAMSMATSIRQVEFENAVQILTKKAPNQRVEIDRNKFQIKIKLPDSDPNMEDDIVLAFTENGKVKIREYTAPLSEDLMSKEAKKAKSISKEAEIAKAEKAELEKLQKENIRQHEARMKAITNDVEKLQSEKFELEKEQTTLTRDLANKDQTIANLESELVSVKKQVKTVKTSVDEVNKALQLIVK